MDLILGDPRWFPHPVRFIGWLCIRVEKLARKAAGRFISLRICGMTTFLMVVTITGGVTWALLSILEAFHSYTATIAAILILYFCIAVGDLIDHAKVVYQHLCVDDIEQARKAVGLLVGRDTDKLDKQGVARACIESVSENLVDGITAPLFWAIVASLLSIAFAFPPILGAAIGAILYKAVNTMDSMFGYKNENYIDFGRFAAIADDVANYIPARLSGLCVIGSAYLLRYDGRGAAKIFSEDRLKSSSPNSGHSEAAIAGALGIEMGGSASYFGVVSEKPLIGSGLRGAEPVDILDCNRLILISSILFVVIILFIQLVIASTMK